MANPCRFPLALAGCGLLLLLPACELGEADVVPHTPPTTTVLSGRDANSSDSDQDADIEASPSDGSVAAGEVRSAADAGLVGDGGNTPDARSGDVKETGHGDIVQDEAGQRCQGWAFCDDFENGRSAWLPTDDSWRVSYNMTSVLPNTVFGPTEAATSRAYVAGVIWQDMTVEARVYVRSFDQAAIANRAEVYARYQDGEHFYAVSLRGDGKLGLRKNAIAVGNAARVAETQNAWHTLKIKVEGQPGSVIVTGYLDGRLLATATDLDDDTGGPSATAGTAGIGVYGETLAYFDDVKVSSP